MAQVVRRLRAMLQQLTGAEAAAGSGGEEALGTT